MAVKPTTVDFNPLPHITAGFKAAFGSNTLTLLWVLLLNIIPGILLSLVGLYLFTNAFMLQPNGNLKLQSGTSVSQLLLGSGLLIIIAILINTFLALLMNRVILQAVQRKKTGLLAELRFAWQRLPLTLFCLLTAIGVSFGALLLLLIIGGGAPALGALLGLVLIVLLIVAVFRFIYVIFILADDTAPATVRAVFGQSVVYWKRSVSAIFSYLLLAILVLMLFNILTGGSQAPQQTGKTNDEIRLVLDTYNIGRNAGSGALSLQGPTYTLIIVNGIIGQVATLLFSIGLAEIYRNARGIKTKKLAK